MIVAKNDLVESHITQKSNRIDIWHIILNDTVAGNQKSQTPKHRLYVYNNPVVNNGRWLNYQPPSLNWWAERRDVWTINSGDTPKEYGNGMGSLPWGVMITLQGTNISPKYWFLKMIFRTSQGGIC